MEAPIPATCLCLLPSDRGEALRNSFVSGCIAVWCALIAAGGCATAPSSGPTAVSHHTLPTLQGSYHTVRPGETLWRIAGSYGLDAAQVAAVNHLPRTTEVKVGQRLFIPLPHESSRFLWPVRGSLGRSSAPHGVEISAPAGSLVRASRGGRVAVATEQLVGWGKTVVIDHLDGYLTIYARLDQVLVEPGTDLRQGTPIASLGSRALHFEIRQGVKPRNTLALLPER